MDLEDQRRFQVEGFGSEVTGVVELTCLRCGWRAEIETIVDPLPLAELNQRAGEHAEVCGPPEHCGWCGELVARTDEAAHPCNGPRSTCGWCGDGMFLVTDMEDGLCERCANTPEDERTMVGP